MLINILVNKRAFFQSLLYCYVKITLTLLKISISLEINVLVWDTITFPDARNFSCKHQLNGRNIYVESYYLLFHDRKYKFT